MCFQFGSVLDIDIYEASLTFLVVVAFLLCFEFVVGLLEYLVSESTVYNQMVQKIYKELMVMGIISFTIVMYEATVQSHSDATVRIIVGIDFNHMLLFFVAIFFVVHALVLIKVSSNAGKSFYFMFNKPVIDVISELGDVLSNPINRFLFNLQYLPFSKEREIVEFKVIQRLFVDMYSLPPDFNVSFYLTGCFEEYTLKAVEGGVAPWLALVALVVLNYIRVKFGLGYQCEPYHRRLHDGQWEEHLGERQLGGTDDGNVPLTDCQVNGMLQLATGCAVLLCAIVITLMLVARLYQLRLLKRVGVNHPDEYKDFLEFTDGERKRMLREGREQNVPVVVGIPRKVLKETVQQLLDEEEHDEETETYRLIVEYVSGAYNWVSVHWFEFVGSIRTVLGTAVSEGFAGADGALEGALGILTQRGNATEGSNTGGSGGDSHSNKAAHGHHSTHRDTLRQSLKSVRLSSKSSSASVTEVDGVKPHPPQAKESPDPKKEDKISAVESTEPAVATIKEEDKENHDAQLDSSDESDGGEFVPRIVMPRSSVTSSGAAASRRRASVQILQGVGKEMTNHTEPPQFLDARNRVESFRSDAGSSQNLTLVEKYKLHRGPQPAPCCTVCCYGSGRVLSQDHASTSVSVLPENGSKLSKDIPLLLKPWYCIWDLFERCLGLGKYNPVEDNELCSIFWLSKPYWFFGAVNVAIMLNCFYMGMWVTNFITLVDKETENNALFQFLMIIPILINFPCIAITISICSTLNAVVNLDMKVVNHVLDTMDDMESLKAQLREKILLHIRGAKGISEKAFMHKLFEEIDVDKSGYIEPSEFRQMLAVLELRYSDKRFRRLFMAVDVTGDGQIQQREVDYLVFPENFYFNDDGVLIAKDPSEINNSGDAVAPFVPPEGSVASGNDEVSALLGKVKRGRLQSGDAATPDGL